MKKILYVLFLISCISLCAQADDVQQQETTATQSSQKDIELAIKLFDNAPRKAFTILKTFESTNDPRILSRIGVSYKYGYGVKYDLKKSIPYFEKQLLKTMYMD